MLEVAREAKGGNELAGRADARLVGRRIKAIRKWQKIPQKDLAELCGLVPSAVTSWEKGVARPTIDQAEKIATRYSLTLDFIYFGELGALPHDTAVALSEIMRRI